MILSLNGKSVQNLVKSFLFLHRNKNFLHRCHQHLHDRLFLSPTLHSVLVKEKNKEPFEEMNVNSIAETVMQQEKQLSHNIALLHHTKSMTKKYDDEMDGIPWIMEEILILVRRLLKTMKHCIWKFQSYHSTTSIQPIVNIATVVPISKTVILLQAQPATSLVCIVTIPTIPITV